MGVHGYWCQYRCNGCDQRRPEYKGSGTHVQGQGTTHKVTRYIAQSEREYTPLCEFR